MSAPQRGVGLARLGLCALLCGCAGAPEQPVITGPSEAELAKKLAATYAAWTPDDTAAPECAVYFAACSDVFAHRAGWEPAGRSISPRDLLVSPDPAWIPGWERIPSGAPHAHVALGALTWGAAMRAHFDACGRGFAQAEAARADADKRVKDALAAATKEPDRYKRLGDLARLRSALRKSFPSPVGPRYTLELGLRAEFERAGLAVVYDLQKQRADDAAALRLPLAEADERDLFCLDGLPAWTDESSIPVDFVRVPIPAARRAELEQKVHAAQDLEAKIPARDADVPRFHDPAAPPPDALFHFEKEVLGAALVVKKVEKDPKGSGVRVTLGGTVTVKDAPYDCRDAPAPSKVKPDGKIVYERVCKRRDETRVVNLALTLADAPDFATQADDQMTFLGTVKRSEQKTKATLKTATIEYQIEVEGLHVLEIWRQQLLAADYFVE